MSQQTDLLRQIAAAMSSGAPDRISDWFTEDFRLHEPGKPALPVGHEGARQMMESGRQNRIRAGVQTPAKVEILDMIQEGYRVAVRWQVTETAHNGNPYEGSCVAIYRFENERIAEDWGIESRERGDRVSALRVTIFRPPHRRPRRAPPDSAARHVDADRRDKDRPGSCRSGRNNAAPCGGRSGHK